MLPGPPFCGSSCYFCASTGPKRAERRPALFPRVGCSPGKPAVPLGRVGCSPPPPVVEGFDEKVAVIVVRAIAERCRQSLVVAVYHHTPIAPLRVPDDIGKPPAPERGREEAGEARFPELRLADEATVRSEQSFPA